MGENQRYGTITRIITMEEDVRKRLVEKFGEAAIVRLEHAEFKRSHEQAMKKIDREMFALKTGQAVEPMLEALNEKITALSNRLTAIEAVIALPSVAAALEAFGPAFVDFGDQYTAAVKKIAEEVGKPKRQIAIRDDNGDIIETREVIDE
jgi:hypothetical protein